MTLKQLIHKTNLALDSWPGDSVDKVNERTCYFYRNQGLLDRPFHMGPFAQYGLHHHQQLLAVKALQREGKSLAEVKVALKDLSKEDLTALLRNLHVPELTFESLPETKTDSIVTHPIQDGLYGQVQLAELDSPANPPAGWVCHPVGPYVLIRPPGTPEISERLLLQIQSLLQNSNP